MKGRVINMSLVTTKEMFEKAMKEGYAIGAFNVNNMEIVQGIVDAAAEQNSPVILQASSSAIKYARINYLMKMVEAAVEEELPQAVMLTARTRAATVTQTFLSFISKISLLLKK